MDDLTAFQRDLLYVIAGLEYGTPPDGLALKDSVDVPMTVEEVQRILRIGVRELLVTDEEFTEADATYALDVLYRRGHIYYVDEEVYITPTDD